ncbi:hypothetical protein ACFOMD_16020 [Sphingoaurantiacus capsulatus]|uniref:Uncharacterized protein n=1 Tax=Sphingoaurantiacus capsulatus TaxID=1771310 RepID=A0ABV7XEB4_9SPHN
MNLPVSRDAYLRLAGLGFVVLGTLAAHTLVVHARQVAPFYPLPLDYLLAAIACLGASWGLALATCGDALFKPLTPPLPGCRCRDCNRLRLLES